MKRIYINDQGVRFNGKHQGVIERVNLMTYYLITNYKLCLHSLQKHDVVRC